MTAKPAPELVNAIAYFADLDWSAADIAAELSTPERTFSRNSIIGIAHRNGIRLSGSPQAPRKSDKPYAPHPKSPPKVSKPYAPRPKLPPKVSKPYAPHVVVMKAPVVADQKPAIICSWCGCTRAVEPGDMFCYGHGRQQLMGAR